MNSHHIHRNLCRTQWPRVDKNVDTFLASLCQLSSDAMRDGRQIPLYLSYGKLHLADLQRASVGNRTYSRDRTMRARLPTELLAVITSGVLWTPYRRCYSSILM